MPLPVVIHEHTQHAFDLWAALPQLPPPGAARAVFKDGQYKVFAGFSWVSQNVDQVPLCIETGLSDANIERTAWSELLYIQVILCLKPRELRPFQEALLKHAPQPTSFRAAFSERYDVTSEAVNTVLRLPKSNDGSSERMVPQNLVTRSRSASRCS